MSETTMKKTISELPEAERRRQLAAVYRFLIEIGRKTQPNSVEAGVEQNVEGDSPDQDL